MARPPILKRDRAYTFDEAIALDRWLSADEKSDRILYGAVTTGEIWRFGRYDAAAKRVVQDINTYRVPEDLGQVVNALVGILEREAFR